MTDNEIIRALECCCKNNNCEGCPFDYLTFSSQCASELAIKSLDLINRLQEEVRQLDNESSALLADIDFRDKELKKLRAENERLIDDNKFLQDNRWKELSFVKAEAYKECIEKVKDKSTKLNMCNSGVIIKTDYQISGVKLDNLLKELVGEDK